MGVLIMNSKFAFDPQNIHEIRFVMKQIMQLGPNFSYCIISSSKNQLEKYVTIYNISIHHKYKALLTNKIVILSNN